MCSCSGQGKTTSVLECTEIKCHEAIKDKNVVHLTAYLNEVRSIESEDFSWELLSLEGESSWGYSFCDNNACYFDLPKKSSLIKLDKKSSKKDRRLRLSVMHSQVKGSAEIRFKVFQNSNINRVDTLLFHVNLY